MSVSLKEIEELQQQLKAAYLDIAAGDADIISVGIAMDKNASNSPHTILQLDKFAESSAMRQQTVRQLRRKLIELAEENTAPDIKAKADHFVVKMTIIERLEAIAFELPEAQESLQLQVLSIGENLQNIALQDRQVVLNSPVKLEYLERYHDHERTPKLQTVSESKAQYIGITIGKNSFNLSLAGDSQSLIKQADSTIHAIYGLQNMLGSDDAAKAIAAVAEMHIYVRTMASNYRHEHGSQPPNISTEAMADFDYIGLAMKKTHAEWIENGPNAAITKWNREKEKLDNFNAVEKDNKRSWVELRVKELAAPKKSPSPFDSL